MPIHQDELAAYRWIWIWIWIWIYSMYSGSLWCNVPLSFDLRPLSSCTSSCGDKQETHDRNQPVKSDPACSKASIMAASAFGESIHHLAGRRKFKRERSTKDGRQTKKQISRRKGKSEKNETDCQQRQESYEERTNDQPPPRQDEDTPFRIHHRQTEFLTRPGTVK
jgi:hypothetical protein